jgi:hypothetical protein
MPVFLPNFSLSAVPHHTDHNFWENTARQKTNKKEEKNFFGAYLVLINAF